MVISINLKFPVLLLNDLNLFIGNYSWLAAGLVVCRSITTTCIMNKGNDDQLAHKVDEIGKLLKNSDEAALSLAVRVLAPIIMARLRRRFGGELAEEDFEDVLSFTLFRLWEKRDSFNRIKGNLLAWCLRVARNRAVDLYREKIRDRRVIDSANDVEGLSQQINDPHGLALPSVIKPVVWQEILDSLSEKERKFISMSFHVSESASSSKAIQDEFGLNENAVRQLRFRIKRKIRNKLVAKGIFNTI